MDQAHLAKQIVLAEDNPADALLVRHALREHDIHCDLHIVSDGESALALIDRLDLDSKLPCPDLLLLDVHLPKCDGFQVLDGLRASERCGLTPVVVLASPDLTGGRHVPQKHPETRYFPKPSSLDKFMQLGAVVKDVFAKGSDGLGVDSITLALA
jgi:CheY-like chemotaxis protein